MIESGNSRHRFFAKTLLANLAGLLGASALLIYAIYPATDAVRVRNAFLVEAAGTNQFDWKPAAPPKTFRLESTRAPDNIRRAAHHVLEASPDSDWDRALLLAGKLTRNAKGGGAIQSDLATTYDLIADKGRGYCADFTKVFLAMANEAGIPVRQWAFSFDGFGGHGHALIEIFDRARGKWLMIDVFNNIYPVDALTEEPIGALEFRDYLMGKRANVKIRKAAAGKLGYEIEDKLLDYYRRGTDQWYLWWANDVATYNANPTLTVARKFGNSAEKLLATVIGVHPTIEIVRTPTNADAVRKLYSLKIGVTVLLGILALLSITFVILAILWHRARVRDKSHENKMSVTMA